MDFKHSDIHPFLLENIPGRFKSLTAAQFKSFIQYLFEVDGYKMNQTSKKGTAMDPIWMEKEGIRLIIRPYLTKPEMLLGEDEINRAVEDKSTFNADQSWVITTSSFTNEARHIAEESDIELWDWDALEGALHQMFFEGKHHTAFTPAPTVKEISPEESDLKLKVKWQATEGVSATWYNLSLTVSNSSARNIYVTLQLPVLIGRNKYQIVADSWAEGDFVSGIIYGGASVKTNALFSVSRIGDRPLGGKVMLTCYEQGEIPLTYHLSARLQGEACYVVTYCYSQESIEYEAMIDYRDYVLSRSLLGKGVIGLYYLLSPYLVLASSHNRWFDSLLRRGVAWMVSGRIKKSNKKS